MHKCNELTHHQQQQQRELHQQQRALLLPRKDKGLWRTYLFINMCCVASAGIAEFIADVIGSTQEQRILIYKQSRAPPPLLPYPAASTQRGCALITCVQCAHDASAPQSNTAACMPPAPVQVEAAHVDAAGELVLQMLPGQTPSQPRQRPS